MNYYEKAPPSFEEYYKLLSECESFDTDNKVGLYTKIYSAIFKYIGQSFSIATDGDKRYIEKPSRNQHVHDLTVIYISELNQRLSIELLNISVDSSDYINAYFTIWTKYMEAAKRMSLCLGYLKYTLYNKQDAPMQVHDEAIKIWASGKSAPNIESKALEMLDNLRRGNCIDHFLFKSIISHIEAYDLVGISIEPFMVKVLDSTKEYYDKVTTVFLSNHSTLDYIKFANTLVRENNKYCEAFSAELLSRINSTLNMSIILDKNIQLLSTYASMLATETVIPDLYMLISREPSIINQYVAEYVRYWVAKITADLREAADEFSFVNVGLAQYEAMLTQTQINYNNNTDFLNASKKVMREAFSSKGLMDPAFAFAEYMDLLLKKNSNKLCKTADEKYALISSINILINFISDKDAYIHFYSRSLSLRLVYGNSDDDLETMSCTLMKQTFGLEHTQKIKSMFGDINSSKSLSSGFDYKKFFEFTPLILTQSIWGLDDAVPNLILPQRLVDCHSAFSKYYTTKFSNKRLVWINSMGRITATYTTASATFTLICNIEQYMVLDLLCKGPVTVDLLPAQFGISKERIVATLVGLAKIKLVGANKEGSKYALNPKFTNQISLINCCALADAANKTMVKKVAGTEITESRKIQTCACIIRIMKKEKRLDGNTLKTEAFGQTRLFEMTTALFKAAIDYCIEKEYLEVVERTETTILYKYIES